MPVIKYKVTRPNLGVEFFTYPADYLQALASRHSWDSDMVLSEDGLTRETTMIFGTAQEYLAWFNDAERKVMANLASDYNVENGIAFTSEIIP